jgi:divalent metal cation (Fe/Co/Zn/Cd) transporter
LGGRSVLEYWRDSRDPTLITVVCEDSAALAALFVALAGTALTQWSGNTAWDATASVVIGAILIGIAAFLAVENYSALLGEAAPPHVVGAIDRVLGEERAVRDLRTMHLGPRSLLIVASVQFASGLDAGAATRAAPRGAARGHP